MESLIPANKMVSALCPRQKIKDEAYRLTRHCLRVPCSRGELLYHTMTGELLLVSAGESLEANREEMIARWFLVPVNYDECMLASQVRQTVQLMQPQKNGIQSFLIFTTTDCNARCYYCYELGRKHIAMDAGTADQVADYILRACAGEPVRLRWFGGEPLFNRSAIDRVSEKLRVSGCTFHSDMVTNGYLFDERLVQTAVEDWKLRSLQIPLDGTEEVYNRAKSFIYPEGSAYQRVMRNIDILLAAGVQVSIRLNLGVQNFDELMKLSDELTCRFGSHERLSVYVHLLQDFGTSPQNALSDEERLERYKRLRAALIERRLLKPKAISGKLCLNSCMADDDNSIVILADGRLGKCEHESEQCLIGHIHGESLDKARIAAWKEHVNVVACRDCAFYPRCTRLKNCAWNNADCTALDRSVLRVRYTEQILASYERKYYRTVTLDPRDAADELC